VLFTWDERYMIGHDLIDGHHQTLVELLNRLFISVQDCADLEQERQVTGGILKELLDYIKYHFHAEQQLMATLHYPGRKFTAHVEAHAGFIIQVQQLLSEHECGGAALSYPVFEFLQQWLVNHIGEVDHELVQYIADLPLSQAKHGETL